MEIRKTGCEKKDTCTHEFEILCDRVLKTKDGFYKEVSDYKLGQYFNIYICKKCSRIVTVDYDQYDDSPVYEFEEEYKVVRQRVR